MENNLYICKFINNTETGLVWGKEKVKGKTINWSNKLKLFYFKHEGNYCLTEYRSGARLCTEKTLKKLKEAYKTTVKLRGIKDIKREINRVTKRTKLICNGH